MKMRVIMKLPAETLQWCAERAAESVKLYEQRHGCKRYNHNNVGSNIVGIKGEVAAYNYLKLSGPERIIRATFMEYGNSLLSDLIVLPNTQIGNFIISACCLTRMQRLKVFVRMIGRNWGE
jgi:hypothetical protein